MEELVAPEAQSADWPPEAQPAVELEAASEAEPFADAACVAVPDVLPSALPVSAVQNTRR
jgi:hypothetical protein